MEVNRWAERGRPQQEGVLINEDLVVKEEASHPDEVVLMELRFLTRGLANSTIST